MHFGDRATPAPYPGAAGIGRVPMPAGVAPLLPALESSKAARNTGSKQTLYRLLGQDLDACAETHANAYEQARKRWIECSMEEWTKGADGTFHACTYWASLMQFRCVELTERFGKLLDFVSAFLLRRWNTR